MTPQEIEDTAQKLLEADATRSMCGLVSAAHPEMTIADAYAVQNAFVARKKTAGAAQIGWKVGFTSSAIQRQMKTDAPGAGVLLNDMAMTSGDTIPAGRLLEPRVEAEVAFVMKEPLQGDDATIDDVIEATDYVAPALEILTTRIVQSDATTGKARTVADAIASNIAYAGLVLGDQRHRVSAHDLHRVGVAVTCDDAVEETGLGAAVLGNPLASVAWLVRHLARHKSGLVAGDIILSGSLIRPFAAPSGATITADFGDFGSASIRFA